MKRSVISQAVNLSKFYCDGLGWYSGKNQDGDDVYNHWSGAKDHMEKKLRRKLSDTELSILSLSLAYGPVPVLEGYTHRDIDVDWALDPVSVAMAM